MKTASNDISTITNNCQHRVSICCKAHAHTQEVQLLGWWFLFDFSACQLNTDIWQLKLSTLVFSDFGDKFPHTGFVSKIFSSLVLPFWPVTPKPWTLNTISLWWCLPQNGRKNAAPRITLSTGTAFSQGRFFWRRNGLWALHQAQSSSVFQCQFTAGLTCAVCPLKPPKHESIGRESSLRIYLRRFLLPFVHVKLGSTRYWGT